jgi:hypothetical protein
MYGFLDEEDQERADMYAKLSEGMIYSAWKSSLKTGKTLRLDWTKTRKKPKKTRLHKTEDWKRLHKDQSLWTGLCG